MATYLGESDTFLYHVRTSLFFACTGASRLSRAAAGMRMKITTTYQLLGGVISSWREWSYTFCIK